MKLTAAIISKTQPGDRLLRSLDFADQIVIVLDGNESKSSVRGKMNIFRHPLDNDFATQRNFALSRSKGDWVLFVDDDEIISRELQKEIVEKINSNNPVAYFIPRKDLVYHQALRHGETGNIKIIRLAKRDAGKFIRPVHETWKIKGRVGEISSPLYHTKDHFVSEFISRMAQYAQLDAPILETEKKPFSTFRLLMNPPLKFILNYKIKGGIWDGYPGLFQAYLMSVQSLSVRVFQWTNKNSS